MRKVELKMNEKEKYEVIKALVDHGGNKTRAALHKKGSTRLKILHIALCLKRQEERRKY